MSTTQAIKTPRSKQDQKNIKLLEQYGAGPIHFAGTDSGLYERHLLFDNVIDQAGASARDRFEAFARSGRDVLSQRWTLTENIYARENPKRVYYLSMEFLIGRSLANNVTNLLRIESGCGRCHSPEELGLDPNSSSRKPDAALGKWRAGPGSRLGFLESMATMQIPATGYGLRYEYGIFKQSIEDGWQTEQPDNWLRRQDPWEVARLDETVEVKLNCSFAVRSGTLLAIPGRPSSLIGIPFDRPVVGYGGKTINTLRLWAAGAPEFFDFQAFSHGDFVGAVARDSRSGVSDPCTLPRTISDHSGTRDCAFVQEYFWLLALWRIWCGV